MKKADLLQALNTKFYKVLNVTMHQQENNLKWYTVKCYDKIGNALRDINVPFYVENEGQPNEVAYWSPSEPKPAPVTGGFQVELSAYIISKVGDGTIEGAVAESIDNVNETAVVRIIKDVSGSLTELRLFIDKDTNGDLQHRQIT